MKQETRLPTAGKIAGLNRFYPVWRHLVCWAAGRPCQQVAHCKPWEASKSRLNICRPKQQNYRRRTSSRRRQVVPRRSLPCTQFHSTRVNVISSAPNDTSTAFPQPVFMKLTHYQQYYVQISYTEFHPNLSVTVGSKDRYSLTPPIRCVSQCTGFHEKHNPLIGTTGGWKGPKVTLSAFTPQTPPPPPDGATARGGPWPPLQCASRPLDSLLCLSIHLTLKSPN